METIRAAQVALEDCVDGQGGTAALTLGAHWLRFWCKLRLTPAQLKVGVGAQHVELGAIPETTLPDGPVTVMCGHGERAMTASAAIDYLAPAPVGARLIADAREVARQGRNVFYDVVISVDGGETIAIVRGRMKILGGPVIEA